MASPVKDAKLKAQARWPGATVGQTPAMVAQGIPARGKGWVHHVHPDNPFRGMLVVQIGNTGWHFGDEPFAEANEVDTAWVDADPILDAPWIKKMVLADYNAYFGPGTQDFDAGQIIRYVHPNSGEDVTFQVQQLQWTNDLDQIEPIADPQQITPTSITDDTITWEDAFGTGIDFKWETQTARLSKRLIIDSLSAIGSPPQFIIDGGNPVLRLQFIFQKSSGVEIWIDGVEWNEKSNNPQSTSGNVEFKLASTSETLWFFKRAWASDENTELSVISQRFRKTGSNLFVDVQVSWSWLETAVYPVIIDPTIDKQVGSSEDDVWNSYSNYSRTATREYVGHDGTGIQETADRFTGISGLSGVTIDVAYFTMRTHISAGDGADMLVQAEDAAAPGLIFDAPQFVARILTSESVAWSNIPSNTNQAQSPSIVSVIQELADSYDPSVIQIFLKDNSSPSGHETRRYFYDYASGDAANLHIEYTAVAAGQPTQIRTQGIPTGSGSRDRPGRWN